MRPWPAEMGGWEIDGQSMIWPGGQPTNLEVLYSTRPWGFENLEMPEVDEVLPRDPFGTSAEHDIEYDLDGLTMPDGSAPSSKLQAFRANYDHLVSLVGEKWTGGYATSTLIPQHGQVLTAKIQAYVSPWQTVARRATGTTMPAVVTVVVLDGAHG